MITKFHILGERCSGTNFLHHAIHKNFNLEFEPKYGHKHFFGHNGFSDSNDCLFVGITREIVAWIDSLYKTPHHISMTCRTDLNAFLNNEFFSVWDSGKKQGKDIEEDYHWKEKRRFKNIFELRATKNNFLVYQMPKLVKHFSLIKYEDLRDNYEDTLKFIAERHNLNFEKQNIIPINKFKGENNQEQFKQKPIQINQYDIINKVDLLSEFDLGYYYE